MQRKEKISPLQKKNKTKVRGNYMLEFNVNVDENKCLECVFFNQQLEKEKEIYQHMYMA